MNNIAMAQAVQEATKSKFKGRQTLVSKVHVHYPQNLEREYERIANTYMTLLNKTLKEHLPTLRREIDSELAKMRQDAVTDKYLGLNVTRMIGQAMMKARAELENKTLGFGLEMKIANLATAVRNRSIREWKRLVHRTLGINILEDYYKCEFYRGAIRQRVTSNVDLIKSIQDTAMTRIENIIQNGYLSGKSHTAMGRQIQEAYGIERRHAQFIARDQTAKLNSDITQAQQKDAGVEEYIWSDVGDERVRRRHAELNGKSCRWDDPPVVDERTGRTAHPGEDYNCRCIALPKFNLSELNLPWEKGAETL